MGQSPEHEELLSSLSSASLCHRVPRPWSGHPAVPAGDIGAAVRGQPGVAAAPRWAGRQRCPLCCGHTARGVFCWGGGEGHGTVLGRSLADAVSAVLSACVELWGSAVRFSSL